MTLHGEHGMVSWRWGGFEKKRAGLTRRLRYRRENISCLMILASSLERSKCVSDNPVVSGQPKAGEASSRSSAGPWSPVVLGRRAVVDLTAIAEAMHARQRDAYEILEALLTQAALWRLEGAELPDGTAMRALHSLPGLESYDPLDWFAERSRRDEAAYQERRRRALVLSDWLRQHAGDEDAEAAVKSVEQDICDFLEVSS